jgi:hypothetical protein
VISELQTWTGQSALAGVKSRLKPAASPRNRPANDFLDSTDYAADTSFTATGRSAALLSFLALTVTQFA